MVLKINYKTENGAEYISSPFSLISPRAQIGKNVEIGPYSIIGDDVIIGKNTKIGPHVYIPKDTIIGEYNQIYCGAIVGADPQDLKYKGERSQLIIGNHNIIREYANISRGTQGGGYITKIGDHNLFMGNVHIAHDVHIGDHNIFSHDVGIAGHVEISNYVTIGGKSGIHQFCKIGAHSMIGVLSKITKDVLPYTLIDGNPSQYYGLNMIGLKRRNFKLSECAKIQEAFRIINNKELLIDECLLSLNHMMSENTQETEIFLELIDFIKNSTRGYYKKPNKVRTISAS